MAKDWTRIRHVASNSWQLGHSNVWAGAAAAATMAVNRLFAVPFMTGDGGLLKSAGVRLTGTGNAALCARVAIYDNTGSQDCYPSTLRVDVGSLILSATGLTTATVSCQLPADSMVWLVAQVNSQATMAMSTIDAGSPVWGADITDFGITYGNLTYTYSFTGFPATFPMSGALSNAAAPMVMLTFSGIGA